MIEELPDVIGICYRIVPLRLRIEFASTAPSKIDNDHPKTGGEYFCKVGEIASVARKAGKAEQRRPIRASRIIAIVEPQAIVDDEIAVATQLWIDSAVHVSLGHRTWRG